MVTVLTQFHLSRRYNNNDALLSQIWVIAKATVLEVCTVPHVEPSVDELLTAAQLHAFCAPVRSIGVATTEDFQDVDDEDLIGCGLNKIQIRRLRRKLLEMSV